MSIDRWDDLKVVLAAARAGTLTGAARALGVDQSTVTRRLLAFQDELGQPLFDRLRGGVEWTPAGEAVVKAATDLEARLFGLERDLTGTAPSVAGSVRVTLPELLLLPWMDTLVAHAQAHPSLELTIVGGDDIRNLTRREADVALRLTARPADHLVGRKLCRAAMTVYAPNALHDVPLEALPWIGWDAVEAPESTTDQLRAELGVTGPYALRVNSYALWIAAGRAGAGALTLPCILGDAMPELERRAPPRWIPGHIWVLTHPDLRRSPRIRHTMDALAGFVSERRAALAGGLPTDDA